MFPKAHFCFSLLKPFAESLQNENVHTMGAISLALENEYLLAFYWKVNSEGTKEELGEACSSKDPRQRCSVARLSEVGGRGRCSLEGHICCRPIAEKTIHMQLSNEVNALAPGREDPSSCNVPPQHFTDKA